MTDESRSRTHVKHLFISIEGSHIGLTIRKIERERWEWRVGPRQTRRTVSGVGSSNESRIPVISLSTFVSL